MNWSIELQNAFEEFLENLSEEEFQELQEIDEKDLIEDIFDAISRELDRRLPDTEF